MSNTRYHKSLIINASPLYQQRFEDKEIFGGVEQYSYPSIHYPTKEEIQGLFLKPHIWTQGDRFYKLALDNYGSYRHWWIIPWFNQKPLESDYKLGEYIYIPQPLEAVLALT